MLIPNIYKESLIFFVMNYVIEGNLDFFAALKTENHKQTNDTCLISGEVLVRNAITLPCDHTFNYLPLHQEVHSQKKIYNSYDTNPVGAFQIKCPYCRRKTNRLLPYIPAEGITERIKGVTGPEAHCMSHKSCSWVFKRGKKSGQCCEKNAFESDHGTLCESHWKRTVKTSSNVFDWTEEMQTCFEKYKVLELKNLLREKKLTVGGAKKDLVIRLITNK